MHRLGLSRKLGLQQQLSAIHRSAVKQYPAHKIRMGHATQAWNRLSETELQEELRLVDLEPAVGLFFLNRRKCVPMSRVPVKLPNLPSALQMSYKRLFWGSPDEVGNSNVKALLPSQLAIRAGS